MKAVLLNGLNILVTVETEYSNKCSLSCQAHGANLLDFFALVFSLLYCWVLIFALSSFYILIDMFLEMMHW